MVSSLTQIAICQSLVSQLYILMRKVNNTTTKLLQCESKQNGYLLKETMCNLNTFNISYLILLLNLENQSWSSYLIPFSRMMPFGKYIMFKRMLTIEHTFDLSIWDAWNDLIGDTWCSWMGLCNAGHYFPLIMPLAIL